MDNARGVAGASERVESGSWVVVMVCGDGAVGIHVGFSCVASGSGWYVCVVLQESSGGDI